MTHKKEPHHNLYKLTEHLNGKHFLYAGLATTTLIGGIGATPVALADKADTNQMELVNKVAPKKIKSKSKKASRAWSYGGEAYEFTADDFAVIDGVITGFTDNFLNYMYEDGSKWDGLITFPDEFATTITGIGDEAFQGIPLRSVNLNALTALETIGEYAFADNVFLEAIDISNLANLTTIGAGAFYDCENLETVNLASLPLLSKLGTSYYDAGTYDNYDPADYEGTYHGDTGVFEYCGKLNAVTISGLDSLQSLTYNLFSECENLATVTVNDLPKLKNIETNALNDARSLQMLSLTNLPNLIHIDSDAFSNWDESSPTLDRIIVGNLNAGLTLETEALHIVKPGGLVIPVDGITDLTTAQKFVAANNYIGDSVYVSVNEKWHVGSAITYKYIDQNEQVIKLGTDNMPVKAVTIVGIAGEKYDLPMLPTIAGYGKPTLVSGVENGIFSPGMNEIVYQYQAEMASFMIYRVDTNDNNLVLPEKVTGFTNDTLNLDDKKIAINGYDFKELNISTLSRAVGDYGWQSVGDSFSKSLTLGANAGRNYKFVYSKTATLTPDKNNDTTNNNNTNTNNNSSTGSSASSSSEKPATSSSATVSSTTTGKNDNSPVSSSSTQNPNALPSTGGNSTEVSGTGTKKINKSQVTNSKFIPLSTDTPRNAPNNNASKALPQSGAIVNHILPIFGVLALTGVIGLYVFNKKKTK
ncbi:LPXTG cell wall anchor domain-containing protein [Periweissella cryptocerci]|uniref:LPXTG cell wall anchor domain-containing protein n=1 Tax=Periweissella cryptocerci TaxID=2506420 RepID=A0A4P6YTC5_9LACO|nr:leucine-rich repeat protein [Periweissella cryptocerci]QBO35903.1 LPXTG cell wall anchor domain-containing protein [Periweissella cryptocerci]